jgi:hypothetical protein
LEDNHQARKVIMVKEGTGEFKKKEGPSLTSGEIEGKLRAILGLSGKGYGRRRRK